MFICFRAFPYLYAIIPPLLCTIPPNHTTSHLTLSSYLSQMAQAPPLPSSAPPNTHSKARAPAYPGTAAGEPGRFPVPDDKLSWKTDWPEYKPVLYTAPSVLKGPVWADPDLLSPDNTSKIDSFNKIDGKIDRHSHNGPYEVSGGVPRNPVGRTGMTGRGLLGRWGPNHAADPIVTRWKRSPTGEKMVREEKGVLEFVGIKRKDSGEWAIPGGMVEAGDTVSATLKKEFGEEAMNSLEASEEEKKKIEQQINTLFKDKGEHIYAGYVDDPRNTDNAWMETVAVNFHDDTGDAFSRVKLQAGDDAGAVTWIEINQQMQLYASHAEFIRTVAGKRGASF